MNKFLLGIVLLLSIAACKTNHFVEIQPAASYRFNGNLPASTTQEDAEISALIAPYKKQLDTEMNEVIGQVEKELTKAQPESTMGNWFADLLYEQSEKKLGRKIDFAIVNQGGMRIQSIPKGPITKRKVFELMPFDNMVTVVEIDGVTLHQLFDLMAEKGGWPISKSVSFSIVEQKAVNIKIDNASLNNDQTYYVSMSDYVANGGSDCHFLKELPREDLGIFLRDLIIEHIEEKTAQNQTLTAKIEGRVAPL